MRESDRILEKYPNRIPIIVNRKQNSNITDIDKSKFLVQKDMAINQFIYIIRKRLKLKSNEAIFVTINNKICANNESLSEIYERDKNIDGYLYIIYSSENTFG
tara:strand:+ start:93 stop:401 length:309 start_codon:yes stop_codon:yes gene_type:complete